MMQQHAAATISSAHVGSGWRYCGPMTNVVTAALAETASPTRTPSRRDMRATPPVWRPFGVWEWPSWRCGGEEEIPAGPRLEIRSGDHRVRGAHRGALKARLAPKLPIPRFNYACLTPRCGKVRIRTGGEGEIRTLDGPVTHNGFRDRRLQPLGHLSGLRREGLQNGGPDRIRTGVLGLDRAACLARLHHGTDGG